MMTVLGANNIEVVDSVAVVVEIIATEPAALTTFCCEWTRVQDICNIIETGTECCHTVDTLTNGVAAAICYLLIWWLVSIYR